MIATFMTASGRSTGYYFKPKIIWAASPFWGQTLAGVAHPPRRVIAGLAPAIQLFAPESGRDHRVKPGDDAEFAATPRQPPQFPWNTGFCLLAKAWKARSKSSVVMH